MNSFTRGCEDLSLRKKECVEDSQFDTCLSTCCTDQCNTGSGTTAGEHQSCRTQQGGGDGGDGGNGETSGASGGLVFVYRSVVSCWLLMSVLLVVV